MSDIEVVSKMVVEKVAADVIKVVDEIVDKLAFVVLELVELAGRVVVVTRVF